MRRPSPARAVKALVMSEGKTGGGATRSPSGSVKFRGMCHGRGRGGAEPRCQECINASGTPAARLSVNGRSCAVTACRVPCKAVALHGVHRDRREEKRLQEREL